MKLNITIASGKTSATDESVLNFRCTNFSQIVRYHVFNDAKLFHNRHPGKQKSDRFAEETGINVTHVFQAGRRPLVIRTSQTHPVLAEMREKQDSGHFPSISGKCSNGDQHGLVYREPPVIQFYQVLLHCYGYG